MQAAAPTQPPRRRGRLAAIVVLVVLVLGAAGTTVWFTVGRDEAVTQLALGTWSCRGLTAPDQRPVEAVIGTSTFAVPELGITGTWRLDGGRLSFEIRPPGDGRRGEQVSVASLPERATPEGSVMLEYLGTDASKQMQWSYDDGRVTFSAAGGELDVTTNEQQRPVQPIGECTKVQ